MSYFLVMVEMIYNSTLLLRIFISKIFLQLIVWVLYVFYFVFFVPFFPSIFFVFFFFSFIF